MDHIKLYAFRFYEGTLKGAAFAELAENGVGVRCFFMYHFRPIRMVRNRQELLSIGQKGRKTPEKKGPKKRKNAKNGKKGLFF